MSLDREDGSGTLHTIGRAWRETSAGGFYELGRMWKEEADGTLTKIWGAPQAPSNLSASTTDCDGSTQVTLTFDDNSNDETQWNVYKDGNFWTSVSTSTQSSTGEVTITADGPDITSGGTKTFKVAAGNSAGESQKTNGADVTFPSVPSSPGSPSLSWDGTGPGCGVDLSWNSLSGVCEYEVIRDGSVIATTSNTSYFDSTANENTSYTYEIRAVNDVGSTTGGSNSITTGTCDDGTN